MEKTPIAKTLQNAGPKAKYDEHVKALLANRKILVWILKSTVDEIQGIG